MQPTVQAATLLGEWDPGSEEYFRTRERLTDRFSRRPLVVGYVGYPPFVCRNGRVSGPVYEALKEAAKVDLGAEVEEVSLDWADAFDRMGSNRGFESEPDSNGSREGRAVDLVVDPTILTFSRAVSVVPYARIRSNMLLFKRDREQVVDKHRWAIQAAGQSATQPGTFVASFKRIQEEIHALSNIGFGFATTEGVFEHDLLRFFRVVPGKLKVLSGTDITTNTARSLNDAPERMVLADYSSGKAALRKLANPRNFAMVDLFGTPIWTQAGFAVHPEDQDLAQFLAFQCNREGSIVRRALASLNRSQLEQNGLEILAPGESTVESFSFVPFWAINGPTLAAGGKTNQREPALTTGGDGLRGSAVVEISIRDISRLVALPVIGLCSMALLIGLLFLAGSPLGFILSFGGGVLGYEAFWLWRASSGRERSES